MKKVCFIVSHLGSSSADLVHILNGNPRCHFYSTNAQYDGPEALEWMFKRTHKCRDSSAVYGDHLLFNMSLSSKKFYEFCKFIYVIRPARATFGEMAYERNYTEERALRHYSFRLRRICEMARRTPEAVLATWDDLAKGSAFGTIEKYLGLNVPLETDGRHFSRVDKDLFSEQTIEKGQDAYERYFYYLSSLDLKRNTDD